MTIDFYQMRLGNLITSNSSDDAGVGVYRGGAHDRGEVSNHPKNKKAPYIPRVKNFLKIKKTL